MLPCLLWGQAGPLAPPFYEVTVTPDGGNQPTRPPNSGPYIATYTVVNTGGLTDTWSLSCQATGVVLCGPVTPGSTTLGGGGQTTVTVSYSVGATGTGVLTLWAEGEDVDQGSYNVTSATLPIVTLVTPVVTSGNRSVVRNRQPVVRALRGWRLASGNGHSGAVEEHFLPETGRPRHPESAHG